MPCKGRVMLFTTQTEAQRYLRRRAASPAKYHRFRSSIAALHGPGVLWLRSPRLDVQVRCRPASLMSPADVSLDQLSPAEPSHISSHSAPFMSLKRGQAAGS